MFGISPDGNYFLYWKDNKFQAYNLDAGDNEDARRQRANVSFVDVEYDHPGPKPSFGVMGYTRDGKNVVAMHRFDLWLVPLDGSRADEPHERRRRQG